MDTAWLRLAASRLLYLDPGNWPVSTDVHAPAGYPLGYLMPNVLDHLTGGPLALLLPWPLSDNLWWLAVLSLNGLAAHLLGRRLGGSHAAGVLTGVAFATCEPVLREANLAHAPQAMAFFAPLYLLALTRAVSPDGRSRDAVWMGLWMALSALTYWYQALFLATMSVPVLLGALWQSRDLRPLWRVGAAALLTTAVVALPLSWYLSSWQSLPNTDASVVLPNLGRSALIDAVPERWQFVVAQSGDPLWWLRAEPLDRSNRVGQVLLVAAALGSRPGTGRYWVGAALAGLMVLGPYLTWHDDPVLLGGEAISLPWAWLAERSDLLARLTWPQRWGLMVPLMLLPLAARSPRPTLLAGLVLLETLLLSGNAPLASTRVSQFDGWRALADAPGPVLAMPVDRRGPVGPAIAFGYRASGVALVNPFDVPPDAHPPTAWRDWQAQSPFAQWVARADAGDYDAPLTREMLDALAADGISAVLVDVTPGGLVPESRRKRWEQRLTTVLGAPVDYGSVLVWWLTPPPMGAPEPSKRPEVWRQKHRNALENERSPEADTVIRKVPWNPW